MKLRALRVAVEMDVVAPGPPEVVWDLITDWAHQGDWMLEATEFTVTSDRREGVGVEAEATVRIAGITTRDKVRVEVWEPSRRLVIRHVGWVSGTGDIRLQPLSGERTYVSWREELEPPMGPLGALGMTMLKPYMRAVFDRDLKVLAALTRAKTAEGKTG